MTSETGMLQDVLQDKFENKISYNYSFENIFKDKLSNNKENYQEHSSSENYPKSPPPDEISNAQISINLTTPGMKIKGRVHCFSMQVVTNKCILLNPEKDLAQIRLVVFKKNAKNPPLIPKNDVTVPKARLL